MSIENNNDMPVQQVQVPYKKHWSFIVCDKKYLYPLAGGIIAMGIFLAIILRDATQVSRVGNLIIGVGVWMSMRSTLREGISKSSSALDNHAVIPGTGQPNETYFKRLVFANGDAYLQLYGFILVVTGSVLGSYGDVIISWVFPGIFLVSNY